MTTNSLQRIIDLLRRLAASTQDQVIRQEIDGIIGETDSLGGDVISVGDISGSTGVAIGRNIEMAINQYAFPEELVEPLRALLDELKPTVFLSYAWDDDQDFVERLHHDLEAVGFAVFWDKDSLSSRGRTILQELRDGVVEVDRVVPVFGPAAMNSENVQYEWTWARKACKAITPVLRIGEHDDLPDDFRSVLYVDFRDSGQYKEKLAALVRLLSEEVARPGMLRGVPSLPAHHLPRRDDLDRLSDLVLSDARSTVVSSAKQTAALQGMGGVGKSVLAAAFARGCETRRAFPDGIFWLTIGQQPTEATLLGHMRTIGEVFGDDPAHYIDLNGAKGHLGEVLESKTALLILDDVWDVRHAEDFQNVLGPRCRMLVTTRDGGLASSLGAEPYRLDVLSDKAALKLLAEWSGLDKLPEVAAQVADKVGNLPFALALCGAMARDGTPWEDLLEALQEADLSFIEAQFPNYPYPDVLRALKVSIDALSEEANKHYHELAVFPEDAAVPEETIVMLWVHTDGLNARNARKLLTELDRKALLTAEGEAPKRWVRLHDLNHDYLRAALEEADTLHEELLSAYANKCANGWATGPNDGYFFQNLPRHFLATGKQEELYDLLFDYAWLEAKLKATEINAIIFDYNLLLSFEEIKIVKSAIEMSAHVIAQDKLQLWHYLYGRLLSHDIPIINRLRDTTQNKPWFKLLTSTMPQAGGFLSRTLAGHKDSVYTVAVTPNGKIAVSGSADKTAIVWDLERARVLHKLTGHKGSITTVAFVHNYRKILTGSVDTSIGVWDLDTGKLLNFLNGHKGSVNTIISTSDGLRAISGSTDRTIRVWDIATGEQTNIYETNHKGSINAIAITPDEKFILTASSDQSLRFFDFKQQEEHELDKHQAPIADVAITPDGLFAASASQDSLICIWDLQTLQPIITLVGHTGPVYSISFMNNGNRLVSSSADESIRIWDLNQQRDISIMRGHAGEVYDVSIIPKDYHIISASVDKTLKVWSISTVAPVSLIAAYPTPVDPAAASSEAVHTILTKVRVHHHAKRVGELQALARQSSGLMPDQGRVWRIQWLTDFFLKNFELLAALKDEIVQRVALRSEYALLEDLPYSGTITLATILAATGDVGRFKNYRQYVAFAGYFPDVRTSQTINRTRMSKRGNRDLRRALFQIAGPLVWFDQGDNPYKHLYERKVSEGRAWYQAMPFVCAALARHIYHCLKFDEPYDVGKAFHGTLPSTGDVQELLAFEVELEDKFETMEAYLHHLQS